MRYTPQAFLILGFAACSGKDTADSATPPPEECTTSFDLVTSTGETIRFPDCTSQSLTIGFSDDFEGISTPRPHAFDLRIHGSSDTTENCWVQMTIDGMCPSVSEYSMENEKVQVSWDTRACGVAGSSSETLTAETGSAIFTELQSLVESGTRVGDPMSIIASVSVSAETVGGESITGTVNVNQSVTIQYVPFTSCAGSESGDEDGDGYASIEFGGEDCDDTDAAIGPHAIEVCDSIDNDCDGAIDEDKLSTYYPDEDGDGWGDSERVYEACEPTENSADVGGDCDDSNPNINPNETDDCDGVDNNCNGVVDESGKRPYYPDEDADGFGLNAPADDVYCEGSQPEGYVTDSSDCDDTDPEVNPDADEVCDGVDNNCDGVTDDLAECETTSD